MEFCWCSRGCRRKGNLGAQGGDIPRRQYPRNLIWGTSQMIQMMYWTYWTWFGAPDGPWIFMDGLGPLVPQLNVENWAKSPQSTDDNQPQVHARHNVNLDVNLDASLLTKLTAKLRPLHHPSTRKSFLSKISKVIRHQNHQNCNDGNRFTQHPPFTHPSPITRPRTHRSPIHRSFTSHSPPSLPRFNPRSSLPGAITISPFPDGWIPALLMIVQLVLPKKISNTPQETLV